MIARTARVLVSGFFWAILVAAFFCPRAAMARSYGDYAISLGIYDLLEEAGGFEGGFEYRLPPRAITMSGTYLGSLSPALGISLTSADSRYSYGGLRLPLLINSQWVLAPHFSAGLFHAGNGHYLGGTLEFRSGIDASFFNGGNSLIGVSFHHLSNGNIYNKNPGSESILLVYSFDSFWK